MKLSELKVNERANIIAFDDMEIALKLMELGCLPGQIVQLNLIAPLGDPIAIEIQGSLIALRKSEADNIHVQLIADNG